MIFIYKSHKSSTQNPSVHLYDCGDSNSHLCGLQTETNRNINNTLGMRNMTIFFIIQIAIYILIKCINVPLKSRLNRNCSHVFRHLNQYVSSVQISGSSEFGIFWHISGKSSSTEIYKNRIRSNLYTLRKQ